MPCDTPPPPVGLEDMDDVIEEDFDLLYEIVDGNDLGEYPTDELGAYSTDDSVVTFSGHKDAVFCCNFDKAGQFAVSGGQDDMAFVWDTATGSTKFECSGHSDSVVSASFSPDSAYVATADMLGLVQVWDTNNGEKVWSFESAEIIWMEWLHKSNVLIAGTHDGNCWKWTIPDGETNVFQTSGVSTTAGCVSYDDKTIVVGHSDGSVKFWSVDDGSVVGSITGSLAHKMSVTAVKYHPNINLILTGSEDGIVKLIKASNYKVLWSITSCDVNHEHEEVSVESVEFFPSQSLLVTGTNCGLLSFWDIATQTKRSSCELNTAIVKILCDESAPLIYVSTAGGKIESYDVRSGNIVRSWIGHKAAILDFVLSPDHRKILSSSDDSTCKIFER